MKPMQINLDDECAAWVNAQGHSFNLSRWVREHIHREIDSQKNEPGEPTRR